MQQIGPGAMTPPSPRAHPPARLAPYTCWLAGSRLVAVLMATMLNPLPLLPLVPPLLLQVYSVAMVICVEL